MTRRFEITLSTFMLMAIIGGCGLLTTGCYYQPPQQQQQSESYTVKNLTVPPNSVKHKFYNGEIATLKIGDRVTIKAGKREAFISDWDIVGNGRLKVECIYSDNNGVIHKTDWIYVEEIDLPTLEEEWKRFKLESEKYETAN